MAGGCHRQGDSTTGHGCWPPTVPAAWSSDVFVNGSGCVRFGDPIVPHTCPDIPETHGGTYCGGGTVNCNGQQVQTVDSPVTCGDAAAVGSPNVFCNTGAGHAGAGGGGETPMYHSELQGRNDPEQHTSEALTHNGVSMKDVLDGILSQVQALKMENTALRRHITILEG